jgi:hypothetical protein
MIDRELMQQALDALESECDATKFGAAEALRARLAQPEPQEAIAKWIKANTEHREWYICPKCSHQTPRWKDEWQGLTDEDRQEIERWIEFKEAGNNEPVPTQKIITYVEAKLKEKGN